MSLASALPAEEVVELNSVADSIILFSFIHSLPRSMKYLLCIIHVLDTVVGCCCCVASVVSESVRPHRQQPTRLLYPWDSPGKNTGVGCHFLLQDWNGQIIQMTVVSIPVGKNPLEQME